MRFSHRLPGDLHPNDLTKLLEEKRRSGVRILDLTESNPTRAGIEYPAGFLGGLAAETATRYDPEPFGLRSAREIIAQEYNASVDRVILSAGTSEAYSWLFKLFCDPGDEVLVPRPSYPLFGYLAALESVHVRHYSLFYDHGWFIDFQTIKDALSPRTRAIVLVNPNNPTGHFLRHHELIQVAELGLPIISDEVFSDYALKTAVDSVGSLRDFEDTMIFSLNGLSKTVGLPQLKLAWTIANGPADLLGEALARLEIIADTYLSVGTPVQAALGSLLRLRRPIQSQIMSRLNTNLEQLRASGLRIFDIEAGWYAILPGQDEDSVVPLLRDHNVLVQPGFFYDFERSGYLILSLLTKPDIFGEGLSYLIQSGS
jgi:aspartate/methionine/tyrosine aminotransferase